LDDNSLLSGWARIVDRIVQGEKLNRPIVTVGPTPDILKAYGLTGASLTMTVAKVARCRREHPDVPLAVWHDLPELLADPLAMFPSQRRDGSMVILLLVSDHKGDPVLVAVSPGDGSANVILSVYGKEAGYPWIIKEIASAKADGLPTYEGKDFAATLPQPPVAEATSSSHGLIPSNGTAKPKRDILSLRKNSTKT
jgi:hypothetical protein